MASPFKSILLASEGTEFDAGAERVGIELAASYGLPLRMVLPVVSNPEYASIAPALEERSEAEAAEKIEKLTRSAGTRGVKLIGTVRLGEEPFREIVNEARERQADLIVLRRRGRRGFLTNVLLGEMVHTVTGHAPCDVLIVPRAAQLWSRAIVVATDGSPHSTRATTVAGAVAVHAGLPLIVISVVEPHHGDEATATGHMEQALAVVRGAGAQATGRVASGGKPAEVILSVAQEAGADLIVIGRRGINRLERILVGSTSERVASHANSAVLIVQQGAVPARD
jgi:nucleotide-binding universal stress UspA family protein